MAAHQALPSLGFFRQEHWSGLPFPSPMHESEKWKWSRSVVSDSLRPHGLQPTRLLRPWDFPGKSTGVGCHCLLQLMPLKLLIARGHNFYRRIQEWPGLSFNSVSRSRGVNSCWGVHSLLFLKDGVVEGLRIQLLESNHLFSHLSFSDYKLFDLQQVTQSPHWRYSTKGEMRISNKDRMRIIMNPKWVH